MSSTPTVAEVLEKENNSFGLIRLVLACCVIVSHSWVLGGHGAEPLFVLSGGSTTLGLCAVTAFFALSGLLVGLSAELSSPSAYLRRRASRILPAYWVCLLVGAAFFGVVICSVRGLDLHDALMSPPNASMQTYLVNNFPLSASQFQLGHVLDGMPYPAAINGSVWSLPAEFACYVFVLAVVRWYVGAQRNNTLLLLITGLSVLMAIMANTPGTAIPVTLPILGGLDARLFFNLWAVFMVGAALALLRHRIRLHPAAVVAAVAWVVLSLPLHVFWPLAALTLPYALVGVAYYLPRACRRVGSNVDISYGMYLYGFPVTQTIVAALKGSTGNGVILSTTAIVLTVPFALASWYGIERPFMRNAHRSVVTSETAPRADPTLPLPATSSGEQPADVAPPV